MNNWQTSLVRGWCAFMLPRQPASCGRSYPEFFDGVCWLADGPL